MQPNHRLSERPHPLGFKAILSRRVFGTSNRLIRGFFGNILIVILPLLRHLAPEIGSNLRIDLLKIIRFVCFFEQHRGGKAKPSLLGIH